MITERAPNWTSSPALLLSPADCERYSLVSNDGTLVHWLEAGEGPLLVVAATLGLPFAFWAPLLGLLRRGHRIVFVKRRDACDTAMPSGLRELGVDAHARDLAQVIGQRVSGEFDALGFCNGVLPLVRSFDFGASPPRKLCLLSGRFCVGDPLPGRKILARIGNDEKRRARFVEMFSAFVPASLESALKADLTDPRVLEAQLVAAEETRDYDGARPPPSGPDVTFIEGEDDYDMIKSSTTTLLQKHAEAGWQRIEIPRAGHFYPYEAASETAAVIERALRESSRSASPQQDRAG